MVLLHYNPFIQRAHKNGHATDFLKIRVMDIQSPPLYKQLKGFDGKKAAHTHP